MTTKEIQNRLGQLVKEERKLTKEILALINHALERRAYLELGYASMFEWLTKEYGYSNAAAYRRIEAARLLKVMPELAPRLERGEVNLSTLAKAQSIFRAEEKAGRKPSVDEKRSAVTQIAGKSILEAEQALLKIFPAGASSVQRERCVALNEETIRLSINLTNQTAANLKRAREILSHKFPQASDGDLIAYALEFFLEQKDPLTSAAEAERVKIFQRQGASCQFKSEEGKVCGSRYQVQVDHIIPKSRGGTNDASNLRILCRQHNLFMAEEILGVKMMKPFWPRS